MGCRGNFEGIVGVFNGIDGYLQTADSLLCSSKCPCYLNNSEIYLRNETFSPFVANWVYDATNAQLSTSFTNCTALHEDVYRLARQNYPNFDPAGTFNAAKFFDYMGRVEEHFKCTGWCSVAYFDPNLNKEVSMSRYLFRDINLGPPTYLGCLNEYIRWVPPYLNAWGSMAMVIFGFQIFTLILALCQCWAREKDHEQQVPHHHDDVRQ
jgi:hypothetical protein